MEIGGLEVFPMQSPSSSPTTTDTDKYPSGLFMLTPVWLRLPNSYNQTKCRETPAISSRKWIFSLNIWNLWFRNVFLNCQAPFVVVISYLLGMIPIWNNSHFAFANKGFGFCTSRWASQPHKASLAGAELGSCGILSLLLTSSLLNVHCFWQPLHLFCGLGF